MDRTQSYKFDTPAYSYAEVELALAKALDAGIVHQRGALRGRVKHLQRLGLVDLKVGRKKRVNYSREQVAQWLLALLLAETGMDPTVVVASLKNSWKTITGAVERATSHEALSGEPYYLCAWPRVMSAAWGQRSPLTISVIQLPRPASFPSPRNEMLALITENPDSWFCVHNLTRVLNRLENALPPRPRA
jgi:hypothetical protein